MANVDQLKQVIAETLSPNAEIRKAAEARLTKARKSPGHLLEVLNLVAAPSGTDPSLLQAAAVHFKNTVKKGWDVNREDGNDGIIITESDRTTIKSHLFQLMCTVSPQIQTILSESISLIAEVDYPDKWDNLLRELVQQFNSPDPKVFVGALKTADSIFKRFRLVGKSDTLYAVILYTLNIIAQPLTAFFKALGQSVVSLANNKEQLLPRMEALRLICRIFYSLNYHDLPEYFEDHMGEWMEDFKLYLEYRNPILVDADEDDEPSSIDKLQAAIIDIWALYSDKDEECFIDHLPRCTELVWNLLINTSSSRKHDILATKSIKFLSSLLEKAMHNHLFQNEETLRQIVLKIVIPNLTFRESDMERFEDDPREFIVTEVEGSDSESRRKCSQNLLRAMGRHFGAQTTSICAEHVGSMLNHYAQDPGNNWAAKDAAINLMMGVAIEKESPMGGVTQINEGVNVMEFFQTQILSDLQDTNHESRPVVKATAIKYVAVFRNQFATLDLVRLMPMLITHLASPVVVVHTFAAYTIERILVTKQETPSGAKVPKFGRKELNAFLEPLFTALFAIIDNEEWNENEYVMKCVMRSLATAGEDAIAVTEIVLSKLTGTLGRVAKNPRNPNFNHCLFESIAVLVRSVCSKDPSMTESMESLLFPPFNIILQLGVDEFSPYVFQVLAQLLEYRPSEQLLGPAYSSIFPALLNPLIYENRGNIPAIARLLQAYIQKAAPELVPQLTAILGVFQKLLSLPATEISAFDILNTAIVHFPQEALEPLIVEIFRQVLTRVRSSTKLKRIRSLATNFFALFVGKYGPQTFFDRMNAVQRDLGFMILDQIWATRLMTDPPVLRAEAKLQLVGCTRLLCESPALVAASNGQHIWVKMLIGIVTLMVSDTFTRVADMSLDHEPDMAVGYGVEFSKLVYAKKETEDPFPEVADPATTFVRSLHGVLTSNSALLSLVHQGLSTEPKLSAGLTKMFVDAGLQLG